MCAWGNLTSTCRPAVAGTNTPSTVTDVEFLIGVQRWINGVIAADLSAFAITRSWAALAAVLPLGITFGAIHALTPGHGKTVLASYLVGSRLAVLRSLSVSAALTATHVGTAVILVPAASYVSPCGPAPALELLTNASRQTGHPRWGNPGSFRRRTQLSWS